MARFLICSFALVLLYPSGIDMYLVGLPRIAQDLGASEAQLHIAFSVYLAGMAAAMLFAGRIADKSGRKPVAIFGAVVFILASFSARRRRSAPTSWLGALFRGSARAAATSSPLRCCAIPSTIAAGRKCFPP
jgi:DHA1 family multidrug resistance protein-like MFS transporter